MVPPKNKLGVIRITFNFVLSCLHSLAKAIGLVNEFDDVSMLCEAVQQSGCQAFVTEDLYQISEHEVGKLDRAREEIHKGSGCIHQFQSD